MTKTKFEQDIIDVLKKHGYKTEGMKQLYVRCSALSAPEIELEYFIT